MNADDLIGRIERHHGRKPRAWAGELQEQLRHTPPDARTLSRARAALARHGLALDASAAVWAPGVGATYALAACGDGIVGRLHVRRQGAAHGRHLVGPVAEDQLHVVFDALQHALVERGRGIPHAESDGHRIEADMPVRGQLDGASIGVALAVGLVSRWLEQPPRADTAASAAVGSDGRLGNVAHLPEKLRALRERYPSVRRVVVAVDQPEAAADGVELLPTRDLATALRHHGLDLDAVPGELDRAGARRALDHLQFAPARRYEQRHWRHLAQKARWLAAQLERRSHRARAMAHAALFHLHAGDARIAGELFRGLDEAALDDLEPGVRTAIEVNAAAAMIDADPDGAQALAAKALDRARSLRGDPRADCLGKALGTWGRALLHGGRVVDALDPLRRALEHHEQHLPDEAAQSRIHLATAQRHAGDPAAALQTVSRLLEPQPADPPPTETSRLFARYERARCLYALGRFDEAIEQLDRVEATQRGLADYPRLGCLRYRVAIARARDVDPVQWLRVAVELAGTLTPPLQHVAVAAVGEALQLEQRPLGEELMATLHATWDHVFPRQPPSKVLPGIIY